MNAHEARKQSFENAKSEIDKIKSLISEAVGKAQMSILVREKLLEGTLEWLNENNYKVSDPGLPFKTKISW